MNYLELRPKAKTWRLPIMVAGAFGFLGILPLLVMDDVFDGGYFPLFNFFTLVALWLLFVGARARKMCAILTERELIVQGRWLRSHSVPWSDIEGIRITRERAAHFLLASRLTRSIVARLGYDTYIRQMSLLLVDGTTLHAAFPADSVSSRTGSSNPDFRDQVATIKRWLLEYRDEPAAAG